MQSSFINVETGNSPSAGDRLPALMRQPRKEKGKNMKKITRTIIMREYHVVLKGVDGEPYSEKVWVPKGTSAKEVRGIFEDADCVYAVEFTGKEIGSVYSMDLSTFTQYATKEEE